MKATLTLLLLSAAGVVVSASLPPVAYHEANYDFYGNDIGWTSVEGSLTPQQAVKKCFGQCTSLTSKFYPTCQAVTYYQGTCYFKSAHGEATYKEGAISSGIYASPISAESEMCNAKVEMNIDYYNNDIGNVRGNTSECCETCQKTPRCRAYSWSKHNGGTCWLKSKQGVRIITKDEVQSALAYPPSNVPTQTVEKNIDFEDHDVGNKPSATFEGCFDLCKQFSGCAAFSWSNRNGGTCWLKSTKGNPIEKDGVYSGVVDDSKVTCESGSTRENTDIDKNDAGYKSGIPNVNDCPTICKASSGCVAFAWNDNMGGTCWLKSSATPTVAKAGVTSCVKIV